jgi:drug/metabolite transporter (DMT)-like permease
MSSGALAALAALTWGSSGLIAGFATRSTQAALVALCAQTVGLLVPLLVAVAATEKPTLLALGAGLAGGAISAVGLVCLYRLFSGPSVGLAAPIAATGSLLPVLVGLAGGEAVDTAQLAGVGVLVTGLGLLLRVPAGQSLDRRTVGLAAVAAVSFGLFYLGLEIGARDSAAWVAVFSRAGAISVLLVAARRMRWPIGRPVKPWLALAVVAGLLDSTGNLAYAAATASGRLSTVSLISGAYPAVTVILAVVVLRQRITPLRAAGILLSVTGLGLVAG